MKARIYVTLKSEVLDPPGDAVRRALATLGFEGLRSVRIGKLVELDVDDSNRARVEQNLGAMCEKLLVNPVIEDFRCEIID